MLARVNTTNLRRTLHARTCNGHAFQCAFTNTLVGVGSVCFGDGSTNVKSCKVQSDSTNIGHGTDPVRAGRAPPIPRGEGCLVKVCVVL